ncbi:SufS family cysteine desulfurase, partial [Patescibacteria group bacterium]|nr:SufS family cysteine desulfurase [Patescibacteria group bacterium]
MFDAKKIQKDFPQLTRKINGKRIVYLDSTATSLKPRPVIDKENEYYTQYTANVFRGIYTTSEEATAAYENSRVLTASFIGAATPEEVVFTRNTSESINLAAYSYMLNSFQPGDRVVTTIMEHHSNFVPWQQLGRKRGIMVDIWGVTPDGLLDMAALEKLITPKTKLLAVTAASNVLGTITPITEIVRVVKRLNPHCLVLVDAAQAVPHMPVNVQEWDADFVAFSSHKMLGPTGIGVLWAKQELLEEMTPFNYGGDMISEVHVDRTVFKAPPHKFEAGTPHIAGVIGFGKAVEYLSALGMENIRAHERDLVSYAIKQFHAVAGLEFLGPKNPDIRGGVFACTLKNAHPHDIAQLLNETNVFIRAGNHCAMPLHEHFGVVSTARASFYVYTT